VLSLAFVRSRRLNTRLARRSYSKRQAEQERLQLESQLQQSRRLESIGRVAGGVAHDFNNLLTVINGYSQILLMGRSRRDRVRGRADQQGGPPRRDLTNQLLTFSRRQVTDVVPLDLNTVIHRRRAAAAAASAGEDVQLAISPARSWRAPRATSARLNQVLMNLVVNARDAMPEGGRIDIATENVA
jgi:signal transduction histidine kinase